jgi:quinol monooxygenase YgiN
MATISTTNPVTTLVNVFTVDPARQQQLVDVLIEATEQVMRHIPGYVSANIHQSIDGTHVVNYAQWRSREAFEAMLQDPTAATHMRKAAALAAFEPHLYSVVYTDERSEGA